MNVENKVAMTATMTRALRTIMKIKGAVCVNGFGGSELAATEVIGGDWIEVADDDDVADPVPETEEDEMEVGVMPDDVELESIDPVGVTELSIIEGSEVALATCEVMASRIDSGVGIVATWT